MSWTWGNYLEGREKSSYSRRGGWSRGLGDSLTLIFGCVHVPFSRGRGGVILCGRYFVSGGETARSSWAGRVRGRMVIPAVSTVRGRGRAAICNGAKVGLLGTCGVRAAVLHLAMVKGAN